MTHLFSPLRIGRLHVPHRILMAPIDYLPAGLLRADEAIHAEVTAS